MKRPWKAKLGSRGFLRLLGKRIKGMEDINDSEKAIKLMRIIRHMIVENMQKGRKVRIPGIGTLHTRTNKEGRRRIVLWPDRYLKGVILYDMPPYYERDNSLICGR